MTLPDFFLFCFFAGFLFSAVALLLGHVHFHFDHGHGGHGIGHGGAGAHPASGHGHAAHATHTDLSPFNMGTVAAFLAWFGGAGYLATQYYNVWFLVALLVALASGVAGASIVFWFLAKVLMREREDLDPADFEMIGVLARVSSTIRPSGTGEILYSQDGFRRAAAARSDDGLHIANGVEVVVTRYENGIAYVRPWDELAGNLGDGRLTTR